jgi:hypothetical protein
MVVKAVLQQIFSENFHFPSHTSMPPIDPQSTIIQGW